ncbi:MAG TPA: hypothetical protein VGL15_03745 [Vicinamibacteria bacterium]
MTRPSLRTLGLAAVLALPPLAVQLAAPVTRLDADAVEYYSHLRSLYFDHDLDFTNEFTHFGILSRWDKTNLTPTGHRRTNFSIGPALLWLPFYAAGDVVASALGRREDGYSPIHIRAVCLGSLVYGVAGLLLLQRRLRELFPAPAAFWATFLTLYATFLFWYVAYEPVMSHAGSFFLAMAALELWWRRKETLSPAAALGLGLLLGLATSVRWQNAVLLLLPALGLIAYRRRLPQPFVSAAAVGAGFLLGVLPQLLAFKAIFGVYLLPYPVQGRNYLRLDRPDLIETFFSSRHGLLYWTPVLWAGLLGYVPLVRRQPRLYGLLLLPLAVMSYVNACSEDWWAGGSYSNRRFDSVLPLLALGLAAALASLRALAERRPRLVLAAGGILLSLWNLLFMEQYRRNLIPRDDTVSFARVVENSAGLVSEAVGSPVAWPANWLFALRHRLPPESFDLMVGRYLFLRQNNLGGVIDLGEERSDDLLAEGWSVRTPCGGGVCRRVEGHARMFAPLDVAEDLDLVVRAAGAGTLTLAVEGQTVAELPLGPEPLDLRVTVPRERWRAGLDELAFTVSPGGAAAVDRVVFERRRAR